MKLLHIDSSITGANSASRQLSAASVAALKAAIPGLEVIRRDLDANPIPHLDSKRLPTVRPANAPEGAVGIADEGGSDVLDEFLSVDIHVIVASSRGGLYAPGMPFEANDFQEKYLRAIFAFLGIGDIEIIRAEGLALSPAHREAALNTAHATIPTSVAARRAGTQQPPPPAAPSHF